MSQKTERFNFCFDSVVSIKKNDLWTGRGRVNRQKREPRPRMSSDTLWWSPGCCRRVQGSKSDELSVQLIKEPENKAKIIQMQLQKTSQLFSHTIMIDHELMWLQKEKRNLQNQKSTENIFLVRF